MRARCGCELEQGEDVCRRCGDCSFCCKLLRRVLQLLHFDADELGLDPEDDFD